MSVTIFKDLDQLNVIELLQVFSNLHFSDGVCDKLALLKKVGYQLSTLPSKGNECGTFYFVLERLRKEGVPECLFESRKITELTSLGSKRNISTISDTDSSSSSPWSQDNLNSGCNGFKYQTKQPRKRRVIIPMRLPTDYLVVSDVDESETQEKFVESVSPQTNPQTSPSNTETKSSNNFHTHASAESQEPALLSASPNKPSKLLLSAQQFFQTVESARTVTEEDEAVKKYFFANLNVTQAQELFQSGVLRQCFAHLSDSNQLVVRRSLKILSWAVDKGSHDIRSAVLEWGLSSVLVDKLRSGQTALHDSVLWLAMNLLWTHEHRTLLLNAGIVEAMQQAINQTTKHSKTRMRLELGVVRVIHNIVHNKHTMPPLIFVRHMLVILAEALQSSERLTVKCAVDTLWFITRQHDTDTEAVTEAPEGHMIIGAAVDTPNTAARIISLARKSPHGQNERALDVLADLSMGMLAHRRKLIELGAVPVLCAWLHNAGIVSMPTVETACYALSNLCSCEGDTALLADVLVGNVAKELVSFYLQQTGQNTVVESVESEVSVVCAIKNLVITSTEQQTTVLVRAGVVEALCTVLSSHKVASDEALEWALLSLTDILNFCETPKVTSKVLAAMASGWAERHTKEISATHSNAAVRESASTLLEALTSQKT